MNFEHVIPRDLFNYAKLFKSLGQLSLHIHDGRLPEGLALEFPDETTTFSVYFDRTLDALYVGNLLLTYKEHNIYVYSTYNSKETYTLETSTHDDYIAIILKDGSINPVFIEYLEYLDTQETVDD